MREVRLALPVWTGNLVQGCSNTWGVEDDLAGKCQVLFG